MYLFLFLVRVLQIFESAFYKFWVRVLQILSPRFTSPRFTSPVQSSPVREIQYAVLTNPDRKFGLSWELMGILDELLPAEARELRA